MGSQRVGHDWATNHACTFVYSESQWKYIDQHGKVNS